MISLIILGAFLWRLRGGLLNDLTGKANWMGFDDTVVRAIWSLGMAYAFWLTHPASVWLGHLLLQPFWAAGGHALLALALFAGTTVFGWGNANITPKKLDDVTGLSMSGAARMSFVALIIGGPWPIIAGLLFGPAYWIGARIPRWRPWMFWGEIICGAMIGACLGMA